MRNKRSSNFSGDKFVRLTVKMDQFEIRESVSLEECSCYSGGGDLSVVVLIASTDVGRSTDKGTISGRKFRSGRGISRWKAHEKLRFTVIFTELSRQKQENKKF